MEKYSNKKLLKTGTGTGSLPKIIILKNKNTFKKQKEGEKKEMMNKRRLLIRYN